MTKHDILIQRLKEELKNTVQNYIPNTEGRICSAINGFFYLKNDFYDEGNDTLEYFEKSLHDLQNYNYKLRQLMAIIDRLSEHVEKTEEHLSIAYEIIKSLESNCD